MCPTAAYNLNYIYCIGILSNSDIFLFFKTLNNSDAFVKFEFILKNQHNFIKNNNYY